MTEFDLKWVHMARYELILKLDGALWLTIISKPLLTPKTAMKSVKKKQNHQKCQFCVFVKLILHADVAPRSQLLASQLPTLEGDPKITK